VNQADVDRARRMIDARQYVLDSDWGDVQPTADDQNSYLESHSWVEYGEWHLGLTDGANGDTKAATHSWWATSAAFIGAP